MASVILDQFLHPCGPAYRLNREQYRRFVQSGIAQPGIFNQARIKYGYEIHCTASLFRVVGL